MRLALSLTPSFSRELFSFRAVAPAAGRGSVKVSWVGPAGHEERERERWVHPFDEARLRSIAETLARLPERSGPAMAMDDAGECRIELDDASTGLQLVRVRARARLGADEATRAFDELWRELYGPVEACLTELGVPEELRLRLL